MTISPSFKVAIDTVDASILLAEVIDGTYGIFEFSYTCSGSTYTIRGGSAVAIDHGAVHLLDAMGFMFLAPTEEFWVKPSAPLPTNLSRTKTQFWMSSSSYSQQYGNSWNSSWRAIIEGATDQWYDLVGWQHQVYPNGHRQNSVVDAFPSFFAANPQLIDPRVASGKSFALGTMTVAEREMVATLAAAYLLKAAQNPDNSLAKYKRREYDANDGDKNTSDEYFAHAMLVCQKVRAGVAALSTYGYGSFSEFNSYAAYSGIPDAELGVYAYAGHKPKPSFDVRPYLYVGVALNFSPESSWLPRMEAHKNNSTLIMTRDYLDLPQYTTNVPMKGRRQDRNYAEKYNSYYAAGAKGMQGGDGNGNWLINLVANRHLNMKLRTGSYTYTQARDDVVNGLFGGDTAVADLYDQWMDPFAKFHRFSLYESMLIIDQMSDGWYKTYFEQIAVMAYYQVTRPARPTSPVVGDAYDLALTRELKHAVGMALSQIFHSYGYLRIYASGNSAGYPHLYYKNAAAPYYTSPTTPTHAEYIACRDALALIAVRDDTLDETDLVVLHNLTPRCPATADATGFKVNGVAQLVFIGPGTVTISGFQYLDDPETGGYTTVPYDEPPVFYPAGTHYLNYNSNFTYTNEGGELFLSAFPSTAIDQVASVNGVNTSIGDLWAYVPQRTAGAVKVENGSRVRFEDQLGTFDVGPTTASDNSRMNNLGPRQIKVDGLQTTGGTNLIAMNQWLSKKSSKAAIPLSLLAEELPCRCVINKT